MWTVETSEVLLILEINDLYNEEVPQMRKEALRI
jgi:hypothetical protein